MTEPLRSLTVSRAGLIGTVIVLVVAGFCLRLGFWQLDRLAQRDARNRLLTQRMSQPPLRIENAATDTSGLLYRTASVEGPFDHDRTIVLAGRSLRGVPGVHVLTPVLLNGGHTAVLVNRGWVPAADAATVELDSLRSPPAARLTGLILPIPTRVRRAPGRTSPPRDSGFQRVWFAPDPLALRSQFPYRLLDFQVQALPDTGAASVPSRLPRPALDRGPHLGYAIQWFSFAAIAVIGWLTLMIRKGEVRSSGRSPLRANRIDRDRER